MTSVAPVRIPRLVRETLYAPACPSEAVAALVDVALTHHNAGRFDDAVIAYAAARSAWESHLLGAAIAEAGVSDIAAEAKSKPWLLSGDPDPEEEQKKAERKAAKMAAIKQKEEEAAASGGKAKTGSHAQQQDDHDLIDDEGNDLTVDPMIARERERKASVMRNIHARRPTIIPVESRIFLHLAVGMVYSSAQADAEALAEFALAKKLLVTSVAVFQASLIAATVYASLGAVYFHLSQFDFAGDYFFRCLEIRESLCGPDHVDTAAALNNVGATLFVLGKASDSLLLFNRALSIAVNQLPASHPRRDLIDVNVRIAKGVFFTDATFPQVPFTPYAPAMIPGAVRAKKFRAPKPKKAAAPAPKKGK